MYKANHKRSQTRKMMLKMRTAVSSAANTTPKRVVLLDFDGVVSRNKAADAYISGRIARVMERATGIRDYQILQEMNARLYAAKGHTWLGLRDAGYSMTLGEFNDILYGHKELFTHICLSTREVLDFSMFMLNCVSLNTDVMFYSNADTRWLRHFVQWNPVLYAVQDNVIEPLRLLKPTEEVHFMTDVFLKSYGYEEVLIVDDNIINLNNIPADWKPIWFSSKRSAVDAEKLSLHAACNSLSEVPLALSHRQKVSATSHRVQKRAP